MAITPEGKVKVKVRGLLDKYGAYYHMPVPTGYGSRTLDFIGCHKGRFFAVETKAKGKKPTLAQEATIARMRAAGGETFVIDAVDSLDYVFLLDWLGNRT